MYDIYEKLNLTVLDFLSNYQKLNRMALATTGLTISQMTVLRYLKTNGPSRITAISSALGMDPGNVSNICSRLEKAGFIEREFPAKDKRLCVVSISEQKKGVLGPGFRNTQRLYDYTHETLSAEEAGQIADALERLNAFYEKLCIQIKHLDAPEDGA